jgi:Asp-tRNA(Asn)/Glu-tRNA(Gln) amidotransferase B subunit
VSRSDAARVVATPALLELLHGAVAAGADTAAAAAWIANDVQRLVKLHGALPATLRGETIAELATLVGDGTLTIALAREVLAEAVDSGTAPSDVVAARGLSVVADETLLPGHAREAVARHPRERDAFRGGKAGLLGFFVGQVMRATSGRGDPGAVRRAVERALAEA